MRTLVPLLLLAGAAAANPPAPPSPDGWSYLGDRGPEHWAELDPAWSACAGAAQSPVDLPLDAAPGAAAPDIRWRQALFKLENDGRLIRMRAPAGAGEMLLDGVEWTLREIVFHRPGEHALGGAVFPLEIQFHHDRPDGRAAVVAVPVTDGGENPVLGIVSRIAPRRAGTEHMGLNDPRWLLPEGAGWLRYTGSLTAPPCTEGVPWLVADRPLAAEVEAILAFRAIHWVSARPQLPLNGRTVRRAD